MAISDKPTNRRTAPPPNTDIGELFVRRFNVVSIYVVILLLLAAAILWSGIKTAEGVQQYHQDYKTLQDMKKQERKLQVEHQRLLIEQQTFSATPQIASRAVAELGMFSPTLKDKLIIQPGAAVAVALTDSSSSSDTVAANDSDIIETDSTNDTAGVVPPEVAATNSDLVEAGQ
ncbi:cell division protein FtsL [Psychrobacter sp. AOP22-C1-22]|uniref:cell division protein FtsL n=1 Tax=unclassified Psychrobacter TaxID=196806 RepID=UPI00178855CA|nr:MULTISPECIES: cell division protein FtsL [unclassified Psychrobacter]MDN5800938.1 cell division protein FtsL [Psychrobacter sp.]MBE0407640.1 cell division protein FtsL [Psychrobacter sp. FME6]MBE0444005.1 cell division protein FtsL [Psychrobacter sp. FME5]MDN5891315.1 cell division protein FtsL [Psychrobacter sp.]MDN5897100.1 cell division protein FtsL [Psychrobacter sp.]